MICFDNVTVRQDSQTIIEDISFTIKEGEKVAFYGKSGAGKTTILLTIVGAHIPRKGAVIFNGEKITSKNISNLRQAVSFIGQEPLLGAKKVIDTILMPYTYRANKGRMPGHDRILETIKNLQLDSSILKKDTSIISGGEKQRVAVAREMLLQKRIFVVDEVTSALDIESRKAVLEIFKRDYYTIISVSHDQDWMKICSRFLKVDRGKIVSVSDTPEPSNN